MPGPEPKLKHTATTEALKKKYLDPTPEQVESSLREGRTTVGRTPYETFPESGYPPVPKPPTRDPLVIGQPEDARLTKMFMDMFPQLRNTSGEVRFGPNASTFEALMRSGMSPNEFDRSNLLGVTNMTTGNIALAPRLVDYKDPTLLLNILFHEFVHSAGRGENEAYPAGDDFAQDQMGIMTGPTQPEPSWDERFDEMVRELKKNGVDIERAPKGTGDVVIKIPKR